MHLPEDKAMNDPNSVSRRNALKQFVLLCGASGALTTSLSARSADGLPHLSIEDPTAKALGYSEDSKSVDVSKFANHTVDQMCSNCTQFQGDTGDAYAGCTIFAGKAVSAHGWCQVWAKRG
jgi:hypothetical protein